MTLDIVLDVSSRNRMHFIHNGSDSPENPQIPIITSPSKYIHTRLSDTEVFPVDLTAQLYPPLLLSSKMTPDVDVWITLYLRYLCSRSREQFTRQTSLCLCGQSVKSWQEPGREMCDKCDTEPLFVWIMTIMIPAGTSSLWGYKAASAALKVLTRTFSPT